MKVTFEITRETEEVVTPPLRQRLARLRYRFWCALYGHGPLLMPFTRERHHQNEKIQTCARCGRRIGWVDDYGWLLEREDA